MRNKFTIAGILMLIPILYLVFSGTVNKSINKDNTQRTSNQTVSTESPKFINMIMNMDIYSGNGNWVDDPNNIIRFIELGYNSVQVYPANHNSYGTFPNLLTGLQPQNNRDLIASFKINGLKFFYEHILLSFPFYAQRIVYEVPASNGNHTTNNGFCFENITVAPSTNEGRTVLYSPQRTDHSPVLLCDGIYENLQHSDFLGRQQDQENWYLKPMVKANLTDVDDYTPIFKMEVYDFQGNLFKSYDIIARDFKHNSYYDNQFTDKYYDINNDLMNFIFSGDKVTGINVKPVGAPLTDCLVDFKIYTYGYVDFYFDKLTVDDLKAHELLDLKIRDNVIENELNVIADYEDFYSYYMDEVTYSQLPCVKYVFDKIKAHNPNIKYLVSEANWMNMNLMKSQPQGHGIMLEYLQPPVFNNFAYEFYKFSDADKTLIPDFALTYRDPNIPDNWKTNNYNEYNNYLQNIVLGNRNLETGQQFQHPQGSFAYQVIKAKDDISLKSPGTKLYFTPQYQGEVWIDPKTNKFTGIREPLNQEIEAQVMIAISHGADGLLNYIYQTRKVNIDVDSDIRLQNGIKIPNVTTQFYTLGLYGNTDGSTNEKRTINHYGQDKWEFIKNMNSKINNWIPTLDKIKWIEGFSVHTEGANHNVVSEIRSLYATNSIGSSNCQEDNWMADCTDERYWEMGFFSNVENPIDKSKYFLISNRRCVPPSAGNSGDSRRLKIRFKTEQLSGFNNWKLIDLKDNSVVTVFDKNSMNFIEAGIFQPGEGKFFQLVPVMQKGGTFVCNEEVSPITFACDSTVFNNGYDLTLYQGTKILFNQKGKIVFHGGSFYSGYLPQGPIQMLTEFCGNNSSWEGVSFQGCSFINISHSIFKNIAYEQPGGSPSSSIQNCAINMINCNNFSINSTQFYLDNKSGAIYYQYSDDSNPNWQNTYIGANDFIINNGNTNSPLVLSFNSLSAIQMPIRIEGNFFNNIPDVSAIAIYINGISGGSVKNNTVHKFSEGLIALSSSLDLYNNTFYSNISSSKSVQGYNGSNINLSPSAQYYTGGSNRITAMNSESINLFTDNSFVFLDKGENSFNISPAGGNSPYHIYGTFPSVNEETYQETYNCFKIDSVNTDPVVDVTAGGNPVSFNFDPYSCSTMLSGDYEVLIFAGLINDTIAVRNIGAGGSERGTGGNISEIQISPCKSLADSININMRKRLYSIAEVQCKRMITLYSDSSKVFDALVKLYLASLSQDSAGIKMGSLKTYYEAIILNNQGKVNLINRCFYLIQKCKVALKQFSSALDGFQLIMQQNPYTYEGLCASWDYAATHLLDSIHGSGGALSNITEEKQLTVFDLTDRYDSTKFTKKQRNDISKTVNDVLESKRVTQTEKIIDLQKKSNEGNKEAAKELKVMKTLNEVVKKKTPNTHTELAHIIQNDIKKVFNSKSSNSKDTPNIIPKTYALYQNYPNPFNPTTKIAYDIPKDAKVKLVIYDILGREMKTLVNNEFKTAGKYITEFNGSNLASGIYFARILVNEGKDFMAVKKMVLVK